MCRYTSICCIRRIAKRLRWDYATTSGETQLCWFKVKTVEERQMNAIEYYSGPNILILPPITKTLTYDIVWRLFDDCGCDVQSAAKMLQINSVFFNAGRNKTVIQMKATRTIARVMYKWWLRKLSRIMFDRIYWNQNIIYRSYDYSHRKILPHWVAITEIMIKCISPSKYECSESIGDRVYLFTTGANCVTSVPIRNTSEWQHVSFFKGSIPIVVLLADYIIQSDVPIQLCCRLQQVDIFMPLDGEYVIKTDGGGFNSVLFSGGTALPRFNRDSGVPLGILQKYCSNSSNNS